MLESRYNVWAHLDSAHYVFNAATGAFRRVAVADHAALERFLATGGREACPLPLLLALCQDGVLVPDVLDEVDALRSRYEKARLDRSHLNLTLVTSLGCNFACPYCYEVKHPSLMGEEVQRSVLRYLDERLPALASLDVCWFGGEPLLGQTALFALSTALIARCRAAGVKYTAEIITNGYLLDEATCQRLAEHCVTRAQVTLDGPPEVHDRLRPLAGGKGTFWQIVKNLRHAVDYFKVTVKVNLDRGSYHRAAALLDILADQGLAGKLAVYADRVRWDLAAPSVPGGCGEQSLDRREFAPIMLRFTALAARAGLATWSLPGPSGVSCVALVGGNLSVGSEGELYPCSGMTGNREAVIGDIDTCVKPGRAQPFADFDPFTDAECRACSALPLCMGGCPRDAVSTDPVDRANRCHELLYSYREQILRCAETQEASLGAAAPLLACRDGRWYAADHEREARGYDERTGTGGTPRSGAGRGGV